VSEARKIYNVRDDKIAGMTDEDVDYVCEVVDEFFG